MTLHWERIIEVKKLIFCAAIFMVAQTSWAQGRPSNYELSIGTLPSMQSYSLGGTGFNTSNGMTAGTGAEAAFVWNRPSEKWTLQFQNLTTKMSAPVGITPTDVNSKLDRGLLNYQFATDTQGAEVSGLVYGLGLEYRGRKADATTPNAFMPSTTAVGVHLDLTYSSTLDENFQYVAGAGLFLPLYLEETTTTVAGASAKTGYYRFGLCPDLGMDLIYKVNSFIRFVVGVHALYEQTRFSDTGTRGVTNAIETTTNVYAPVELRFQF